MHMGRPYNELGWEVQPGPRLYCSSDDACSDLQGDIREIFNNGLERDTLKNRPPSARPLWAIRWKKKYDKSNQPR